MGKYFLIIKSNFTNNIKKYVILILVFILSFMSMVVSFDFKKTTYDSVWNTLEGSTTGIHLNVSSADNNIKMFDYSKPKEILDNNEKIDYYVLVDATYAECNNSNHNLYGIYESDYTNLKLKVLSKSTTNYEDGAYISKSTANMLNISLDQEIEVSTIENTYKLHVEGITDDSLFMIQNDNPIIIDFDFAAKILNRSNLATSIFVRTKSLEDIDIVYNELKIALEDYNTKIIKTFNPSSYTFYLEPISIAIKIFSAFSIMVSVILCYFIYNSLILSRIKRTATLKSLGVTKKELYISSLIEGLIILIISILFGSVLALFTNGILAQTISNVSNFSITLTSVLISAGIVGVIILCNIYVTHHRLFKTSIIELTKGKNININNITKTKKIILIIVLFVILSALIALSIFSWISKELIFKIIGIVTHSILIISISFVITILVFKIISQNGKLSLLYKQMIKKKMNYLGIISLVVIVVSLISMISILSATLTKTLGSYYNDIDALMMTYNEDSSDSALADYENYGIDKYYKTYNLNQNIDDYTLYISGVDTSNYLNYTQDVLITDNQEELLNKLNTTNDSIIISTTLANKNNLKIGDYYELLTINGNKKFLIVGLANSFENGGNNIVTSYSTFKDNFIYQYVYYYMELVSGASFDRLIAFYNEYKSSFSMSIYDMQILVINNNNSISKIFTMIYALVIVLSIIAIINIIFSISNSIKINYKDYSVWWSLGINRKKIFIFIIKEYAIVFGIAGLLTILATGKTIELVYDILNISIGFFTYSYNISMLGIIAIFAIFLLSMPISIVKIAKLNMVDSIKGGTEE